MQIEQIPDSRRAILETLKQHGHATIARLAGQLQLTGEAVRQQLLQLRREGWVEASETERPRIGRPATAYRLTVKGDHLFPKQYDALVVALIDAISGELPPEVTLRLLARLADEMVSRLEPTMRVLPIEQRIQALKDFYRGDDAYMTFEHNPDGFCLIQRNCPFYNVAMQRPAICDASINAMSRLLGVRVERDEGFQTGHGRCRFRVLPDQPVDAGQKLSGGESAVRAKR